MAKQKRIAVGKITVKQFLELNERFISAEEGVQDLLDHLQGQGIYTSDIPRHRRESTATPLYRLLNRPKSIVDKGCRWADGFKFSELCVGVYKRAYHLWRGNGQTQSLQALLPDYKNSNGQRLKDPIALRPESIEEELGKLAEKYYKDQIPLVDENKNIKVLKLKRDLVKAELALAKEQVEDDKRRALGEQKARLGDDYADLALITGGEK